MLQTLKRAWNIEEIRKKIIFTLLMVVVYRLGNAIPVPFIDKAGIAAAFSQNQGGILDF